MEDEAKRATVFRDSLEERVLGTAKLSVTSALEDVKSKAPEKCEYFYKVRGGLRGLLAIQKSQYLVARSSAAGAILSLKI